MTDFMHPQALWLALIPLALTLFTLLKKRKRGKTKYLLLSPSQSLLHQQHKKIRRIHRIFFALSLIAFFLLIIAIARPVQQHRWTEKWTEGIDIVIALDVSESMDATDFKPNRITTAKKVIRNFIEGRKSDRIGLVIFGGESVTKCPLTRDYDFLTQQLEDVKLRELKQGTAIGMALASSVGKLKHSKAKNKIIVLITDGDSNVGAINPITATELAREEGIKIYSIGIGRKSRVLVPIYAYDMYGNRTHLITQVPSYLNPELLKDIARRTGGKSYMATSANALRKILQEIDQLETTKVKILPKTRNEELFFSFALIATLLLGLVSVLQATRYRRAKVSYAATV